MINIAMMHNIVCFFLFIILQKNHLKLFFTNTKVNLTIHKVVAYNKV